MGSRLLYQRAGIRQTNTEESSGNAEAEERLAECAAHDHGDNAGGTRAESHANADFGSAASDGIGSESIQADGGQKRFGWSQLSGAPGFNFSPVSFLMEAGPLYSWADASSCKHD